LRRSGPYRINRELRGAYLREYPPIYDDAVWSACWEKYIRLATHPTEWAGFSIGANTDYATGIN